MRFKYPLPTVSIYKEKVKLLLDFITSYTPVCNCITNNHTYLELRSKQANILRVSAYGQMTKVTIACIHSPIILTVFLKEVECWWQHDKLRASLTDDEVYQFENLTGAIPLLMGQYSR